MSNPNISVAPGGLVTIGGFTCGLGKVARQTVDVSPLAGETVRIWLDADRKYSTDPRKGHYWQVAEFEVPAQEYRETAGEDGQGDQSVVLEAVPVDLADVEIKIWPLPA